MNVTVAMSSNTGWDEGLVRAKGSWFTKHCYSTENPQTYWGHCRFAFSNSIMLLWIGIAGCVHAILPPLFPFYTSTRIIRSFGKLVDSRRHESELKHEVRKMRRVRVGNGRGDPR